jgi:hypothetical protein
MDMLIGLIWLFCIVFENHTSTLYLVDVYNYNLPIYNLKNKRAGCGGVRL